MLENIKMSFRGIWSHKLRSFLTMLGIIIGIAAIIAIVSTIQGTNEMIKQNMLGNARHTVKVELYQDDMKYEVSEWQPAPEGIPRFTESVRKEVLDIPNVLQAAFYRERSEWESAVYFQDKTLSSCRILGVDEKYFATAGYAMRTGRGFLESDGKNNRQVAVIDETLARSLFADEEPVGKIIEIHGEPFTVIGVCYPLEVYEPVIQSEEEYWTYQQYRTNTGALYVPAGIWGTIYTFDEPQNLLIQASGAEEMAGAGKAAAQLLNDKSRLPGSSIAYKAEDLLAQARQIQDLQGSTNRMLLWIAGISLIVGGIGVANIMLVSVTERTREIGLKKAIGARKGRILGQFLTEAAILTSLGGMIGVAAGIGLARLISKIASTPVAIDLPWIFLAVGISTGIGLISGLLPSIKAANLNPIEALRHG